MRHQRFKPSPSQLSPAGFNADFSAVAHHHDLLNRSSTAWFDACLCQPTPRGLPSSPSVAGKNRSVGPSFHVTLSEHYAERTPPGRASVARVTSNCTTRRSQSRIVEAGCRGYHAAQDRSHSAPRVVIREFAPHTHVAIDDQLIENPGYNRDRGPASVFAVRLHPEFRSKRRRIERACQGRCPGHAHRSI